MVEVQGSSFEFEVSVVVYTLKHKYLHHFDISENTLIGATNDENGQVNSAVDFLPNEPEGTIPEIAKRFKARNQPWMIVTDVSYPSVDGKTCMGS